jgi:hypothetical protein
MAKEKVKTPNKKIEAATHKHPESKNLMRPEVGTQAQFKKKKPSKTYRYDHRSRRHSIGMPILKGSPASLRQSLMNPTLAFPSSDYPKFISTITLS